MGMERAARGLIRIAGRLVDLAVLTAILSLAAVGLYAMWDSKQVFGAANAAAYEIYRPDAEDGGQSFEELRAINPEVFAWLTVYGTNIDYPVVQGDDNMKYVNANARGQYSLSGAIFKDARSDPGFSEFSSILYGHHMENQVMFGEIGLFAEEEYFRAREHGTLFFDGETRGLDFFLFLSADAYDGTVFRTRIVEPEDREAYLGRLWELAIHTRELEVTAEDRIVLLSTCSASATNGRDILVAKIVEEIHEDPFYAEPRVWSFKTLDVDSIRGLWDDLPLWGRAGIAAAIAALAIWAVRAGRGRARARRAAYGMTDVGAHTPAARNGE